MMGHEHIVLPPAIKAIAPGRGWPGPCGRWRATSTAPSRARDAARLVHAAVARPSGHVVVCQPNNHEVALMGELSRRRSGARRAGYVVDGGSRDTDLVLEQGFPVFLLVPHAVGHRRAWIPDRYGEPITIGTVTSAAATTCWAIATAS
jgi:regulator of RNase E activity RraA